MKHYFVLNLLSRISVFITTMAIWCLMSGSIWAQDGKNEGLLGGLNSSGWGQNNQSPPAADTSAQASTAAQAGRPANMPIFRNPSDHPAMGFEGNYEVTAEGLGTMYVGIRKGANYGGDAGGGLRYYYWGRNPKADWQSVSDAIPPGKVSFGKSVEMKNFRKKGAYLIWDKADYYDGLLDEFYQIRAKPLDRNFNRLVGNWRVSPDSDRKKKNGRMTWRRLKPKIKSTKITLQRVALSPSFDSIPRDEVESTAVYGEAIPTLDISRLKSYFGDTYATMRGNRPGMYIEIYGDDMWDRTRSNSVGVGLTGGWPVWIDPADDIEVTHSGSQPIFETLPGGEKRVIGAKVAINLWQNMKPGIHTLYFDGQPIPFKLTTSTFSAVAPPPTLRKLSAVTIAGTVKDELYEGDSFQIEAVYAEDHVQSALTVNIPPPYGRDGDGIDVILRRQDDKAVFKSEVLRLEHADWNENELLSGDPDPDARAAQTRSWLNDYLDGNWVISDMSEGDDREDRAQVLANESRLYVQIGEGRNVKFYESSGLRTDIGDNNGEPFPRLVAMLDNNPFMARYYRQNGSLENYGAGRALTLKNSRISLTLTLEDKETVVGTTWKDDGLETAQLQLYAQPGNKSFEGFWETRRGDSRTGKAHQLWSRNGPLKIASATLLDDQFTRRPQADDTHAQNYLYPFNMDGSRTLGTNERTIVILGRNLPSADDLSITPEDETIRYEASSLPPPMQQAFRKAALSLMTPEQRASSAGRDEEVLVLKAVLKPGVKPGAKKLHINEILKSWELGFRDQIGHINFIPAGEGLRDPADHLFYQGQGVQLAVKARERNFPIDGAELKLEAVYISDSSAPAPPRRRPLGTVTVTAPPDAGYGASDNVAVSDPMVITIDGLFDAPSIAAGETLITLKPGERLVASAADPLRFIAVPPMSVAKIEGVPTESSIWRNALIEVAKCPGVTGNPREANFDRKISTSIERFIFMDWLSTRSAKVTNGDHAALLLLRDEIVRQVSAENNRLEQTILYASNPSLEALRFRNNAAKNPAMTEHPFWKFRVGDNTQLKDGETVRVYGPGEADFKLAETLNMDRFMQDYGHNRADASDIIAREVLKHVKKQHADTNEAIERARSAGNCNLDELLVIAGQKSSRAVASLWPNLVKQQNGRWMPDNKARTAVSTVYGLGEEVRALERLSDIDDAYASMAVALASGGLAAGGTALGALSGSWAAYAGTSAAYMALALDAADIAYFGLKGVNDYLEGEDNYVTALGLSPTLGSRAVEEADANRKSPIMAAVGILAPGVGTAASLSRLRSVHAIEKGRLLLREGVPALDQLSNADRLNLAAYYKYLEDAKAGKTSGLFKSEAADLKSMRSLIKEAGGEAPTDRAIRAAQKAAQDPNAGPPALSEADIARQLDSFGDDIDDLIKLPGQAPRQRTALEKTEVDLARKNGDNAISRTEVDTVNPRPGSRTALDKEPPLKLPADVPRDLTSAEPGKLSEHLSARDVAKLMQLKRPLTPDENLMREDLLRQYVNNPSSVSAGKRAVLEQTTKDRNAVIRLAPDDASAPLVTVRQLDDLLEAKPGSLSEHLSEAEVDRLFRPGVNDLTPEDLILKMDVMRSPRAPEMGPADPAVRQALVEMFDRRRKLSTTLQDPLESTLIDALPGSVVQDINATRIEPITELPGNAAHGPTGTQVLLRTPVETLRTPSAQEMSLLGPFTRSTTEVTYGQALHPSMRTMPPGRTAQTASPKTPMILDRSKSDTYLYTILPSGEVKYVPQLWRTPARRSQDEVFKHTMMTSGGVAGQSGEIKWVNGAWQIDGASGRYGWYFALDASNKVVGVSRTRRSLDTAKNVLERYGVMDSQNGAKISLQQNYHKSVP